MLFKTLAFASAAALLSTAPCSAATLYVAANGSGSTTSCPSTAPCASLTNAVLAAAPGDTVVCLSTPTPGEINIAKSITIECATARAVLRDSSINTGNGQVSAIYISITPSQNDPLRTVRLRGLTIDGSQSTNMGFNPSGRYYDRGIEIQDAAAVYIEDCVVSNVKRQGIYDRRTSGQTKLFVRDTTINGNVGAGIALVSQNTGVTVLDNVHMENNAYGVAVATGNNVFINRSVMSGNSQAGVEADSGAKVNVSNSVITHNNVGVQSFGGAIRLRENDVAFNNTAVQGSTLSLGVNRFSANGSIGQTPSLVSGAQADVIN